MKSKIIINERGAALVIALLVMTALTFLGIASINTSSTDIMISGNHRRSVQTLDTAEAGIQEVISRMQLRPDPAVLIADGGSKVYPAVNGIADAYIGDSIASPSLNWETRIFFTGSDPVDSGSIVNTSSLLSSNDRTALEYSETSPASVADVLRVRHEKESDLGVDLNGDTDQDDLVYFDRTIGRNASAIGYIVELITSTGKIGNSRRTVQVEACRFPLSINPKAAVTVGMTPTWSGSAFMSGFDHAEDTDPTDDASGAFGSIQTNGVDNYGGQGADGDTNTVDEPELNVDYFSKLTGDISAYVPGAAVTSGLSIGLSGSLKIYGGNDTVVWKDEAIPAWETLAQMLGITDSELATVLSMATVTEADMHPASGHLDAAPQGIIYIDNMGGNDVRITASTPSSNNGFGLMYITGNASFQSLTFKGLIFIEGDASITGNFWIMGAFANKGITSSFAAGNGTFLFSSAALMNINQYMGYSILSWKDTE